MEFSSKKFDFPTKCCNLALLTIVIKTNGYININLTQILNSPRRILVLRAGSITKRWNSSASFARHYS